MGVKQQRLRSVRFTTRWLESVKPPAKGQVDYYDLSPGSPGGFGVRVSQGGTRSFFLLYRRDRVRKRWTIGQFPRVSLKEARKKAGKVYHSRREDPLEEKKKLHELGTFGNLAKEYLAENEANLAASTRREFRRIIERNLIPEFGEMHAGNITRADVKKFLKSKKDTPYRANRDHAVMRLIFAWAMAEDRPILVNPCEGIDRKQLGTTEKKRQRVLSAGEIRALWTALDEERPIIASIFKLLLLTGVRSDEAKKARWNALDFEEQLWRIRITKNGDPHEVPLTESVVAIFESMRPLSGHSEYVFLGPIGKPIGNLQKAKERLHERVQLKENWRIHDIRRTVATKLATLGVPRDTVSAVLGHTLGGNPTTDIYERYGRLPEKRAALEKWARRLEKIVSGEEQKGTVVAFGSK